MSHVIGIRRETKSTWEQRTPLTPTLISHLVRDKELEVVVQPSARRVFHDKEFVRAGADVTNDLSRASVVFGVKEIPPDKLEPDTAYVFFSHVIKGQPYNMPMLARLMELGCTLIDYETVTDDAGRRQIFFGRFAGLAGMIDGLWALGQRLQWEGVRSPFSDILTAHEYDCLDDAEDAIQAVGNTIARHGLPAELSPFVVGIAGYGNVAKGVREILAVLPTEAIPPDKVTTLATSGNARSDRLYQVTFKEQDLVVPREPGGTFELQDYYDHPERYQGCFAPYLPHLSMLINCNYWDSRYPRLVSKEDVKGLFAGSQRPRLRVIGDLSCDIEGAVECTLRCTEPGEPVYVYDSLAGTIAPGVEGDGPVILAVDILPAELPRDASEAFSQFLAPYVPGIARADYGAPFEQLDLPPDIKRAVIVHRGELTPDYAHLAEHLRG